MQSSNIKYMSHSEEVKYLMYHLRTGEKSLMNYMEEEDGEQKLNINIERDLNLNNLKIFLIKDIVNKLREAGENNNHIVSIKSGVVGKKSDKGVSWEEYVILTLAGMLY
jgi:hypothetical protein